MFVATQASKTEAYKKTATKMETKWSAVLAECLRNQLIFSDWNEAPPSWETLQTAFGKWTKDVLKKYGISEEGANLSGLEEDPGDFDKLILSMAEDNAKGKKEKAEKQEQENKRKQELEDTEYQFLKQSVSVLVSKEEETDSPEGRTNNAKAPVSENNKGKKRSFDLESILGSVREDDRIIDLSVERHEEELAFTRKKNAQDLELTARKFEHDIEMEKQRMIIEAKRVENEANHSNVLQALLKLLNK